MKIWQVNLKVVLSGCTAKVRAATIEEARDKAEAGEFIDAIELGTGEITDQYVTNIKEG